MKTTKRGFTLIELLVVIAIIAILAAILFPVFAKAREKARQATCLSNVKQLTLGILQYTIDYDEIYPAVWLGDYPPNYAPIPGLVPNQYYYWYQQIYPYVKNLQVFKCPSDGWAWSQSYMPFDMYRDDIFMSSTGETLTKCSYCINDNVDEMSEGSVADPAGTFLLWDTSPDTSYYWTSYNPASYNRMRPYAGSEANGRHNGGENYGFCDGHAKWFKRESVPAIGDPRWGPVDDVH